MLVEFYKSKLYFFSAYNRLYTRGQEERAGEMGGYICIVLFTEDWKWSKK